MAHKVERVFLNALCGLSCCSPSLEGQRLFSGWRSSSVQGPGQSARSSAELVWGFRHCFHLLALQAAFQQQRAVCYRAGASGTGVPIAAFGRQSSSCRAAAVLPCPQPCRVPQKAWVSPLPPAPWEERATYASPCGTIPEVLSCPQSWMGSAGLQGILILWQWHCRNSLQVLKAADFLTLKVP